MNIYVGNLLFDVTEDELRGLFEPFGQVTEVRLIMDKFSGKSKGFGFIEMPSKEEAEKAIDELNTKDLKVVEAKGGEVLVVAGAAVEDEAAEADVIEAAEVASDSRRC